MTKKEIVNFWIEKSKMEIETANTLLTETEALHNWIQQSMSME